MNKSILPSIDTPPSCRECELSIQHMFSGNLFIKCPKGVIKQEIVECEKVYNKVHPQCPLQDTTKLLEALEDINDATTCYENNCVNRFNTAYNKLYKALGGK